MARAIALVHGSNVAGLFGQEADKLNLAGRAVAILKELGETHLCTGALNNMADAADALHDHGGARRYLEEALAMGRAAGDMERVASTLLSLCGASMRAGQYEEAIPLLEEALPLSTRSGDRSTSARVLRSLAHIARARDEFTAARWYGEASLAIGRETGDLSCLAASLESLDQTAGKEGNRADSVRYLRELVRVFQQLDVPASIADTIRMLACQASANGDLLRAARLLGAADSVDASGGASLAARRPSAADLSAGVRAALGETAFAEAVREGRSMSLERAVAYASAEPD